MFRIVMPFVGKTDCYAVAVKGPKFLNETILKLIAPFAGEKLDNGIASHQELRAIPPHTISRISQ